MDDAFLALLSVIVRYAKASVRLNRKSAIYSLLYINVDFCDVLENKDRIKHLNKMAYSIRIIIALYKFDEVNRSKINTKICLPCRYVISFCLTFS